LEAVRGIYQGEVEVVDSAVASSAEQDYNQVHYQEVLVMLVVKETVLELLMAAAVVAAVALDL
jgi:alkylhydroperoxidase/carboxymuconolactone decarboxylase family protein YurZ